MSEQTTSEPEPADATSDEGNDGPNDAESDRPNETAHERADETESKRATEQAGDSQPRHSTSEEATARTGHWRAGVALALAAASAGVVLGNTAVFLAALVGLVYSGYTSLSAPPRGPLFVERTVTPRSAAPRDRIAVELTVENVSGAVLSDVRVADQPPAGLDSVDGETRAVATLEPGETLTVDYALRARRGTHAFDDAVTVVHTTSGGAGRQTIHDVADEVRVYAPFDAMELAPQTGLAQGRVETDSGGQGLEFYATRDHHPSDPIRRIDWTTYAKRGELTTVTYRESHAATVVLIVDGRHRVSRRAGEPDAAELCGYATVRIAETLLDDHNSVGAVVMDDTDRVAFDAYCRPDRGREQQIRVQSLLAAELGVSVGDVAAGRNGFRRRRSDADPALTDGRQRTPSSSAEIDWLRDWLDDHAQVVLVSPLDDDATTLVERLESIGHTVTVVSPRVTATDRPGATVEHLRRTLRVRALRGDSQVRLVDWSLDEPLEAAVDRATRRWDR